MDVQEQVQRVNDLAEEFDQAADTVAGQIRRGTGKATKRDVMLFRRTARRLRKVAERHYQKGRTPAHLRKGGTGTNGHGSDTHGQSAPVAVAKPKRQRRQSPPATEASPFDQPEEDTSISSAVAAG